jgi:hypothetical protein
MDTQANAIEDPICFAKISIKYYDKIYEINEIDIEVYNTLKEKMK